ncbi:MAG: FHA domain-containing protein [Pseudomonadota bacterium]
MGTEGPHLFRFDTGEELPLSGTQVIGRNTSCNYVIEISTISQRHASITVNGEMALIQDLGSTNGTYIREKRVERAACLQDGDRFRLHETEFEFRTTRREGASDGSARTAVGRATAPSPLPLPTGWDAVRVPTLVFPADRVELALTSERQEWTVGRGLNREVRIDHPLVSKRHAKIVRDGDVWKVMDLVSTNQTWVNEKLVASAFLQSRDRLAFGPVACVFLLPRSWGKAGA